MQENENISSSTPKKEKKQLSKKARITLLVLLWLFIQGPFIAIFLMIQISKSSGMPDFEELENPQSNLASTIFTGDGKVMGKYFRENRTNVKYHQISPYLIQALIATEDERFHQHAGVDLQATGRVMKGLVQRNSSQGGGSTISQQLAKMLFPREKMSKWELVKRKFKEWVIATRLEKSYTKEEIITMYLNKFDFLNLSVGISSASQIYFSTTPDSLKVEQAAMLVGMCKNPSLFNPLRFEERVVQRRSVVLKQMEKNGYISQVEYDSLKALPLGIKFSKADHQTGLAPYFRETLREEVTKLLDSKDGQGNYIYAKKNGKPYDIYSDGLKIYTTIDSRMQAYAEWAVEEHLKYYLQRAFDKNNEKNKLPPFSNDLKEEQIDNIMNNAIKRSKHYRSLAGKMSPVSERTQGITVITGEDGKKYYHCAHDGHKWPVLTEEEIFTELKKPKPMRVFSWAAPGYEKDTIMSPYDSVRYYKGLLRASLVSMDPNTGFVKAWVGGPNFMHFKFDQVKKGRRQVGSTFKPFVYATAIANGIYEPCSELPNIEYCIEVPYNHLHNKLWCPSNSGEKYDGTMTPLNYALAASMNNITAKLIKETKPENVIKVIAKMGIDTTNLLPVPSMALGVFDISVYEMVGALNTFVNQGVYIKPIYVSRIEDKQGNVIYEAQPEATEVFDEETSHVIIEMMKGVCSGVQHPYKTGKGSVGGTALRIRGAETKERPYAGIKTPIAGKTGTTQNQSDGWFMGLTPDLVTGVWVGAEDRAVRFRSLQLGMGTNTALPIWAYYMKKVYADSTITISKGDFEKPAEMIRIQMDCKQYRRENNQNFFNPDKFGGYELWED
jgi:penicillin-binding protein 1A